MLIDRRSVGFAKLKRMRKMREPCKHRECSSTVLLLSLSASHTAKETDRRIIRYLTITGYLRYAPARPTYIP